MNENEIKTKSYKISVTTPNSRQLTYNVDSYEIVESTMIRFFDKVKSKYKLFDLRNVEITEND